MKLWLCGLVVAFAAFVHVETHSVYEGLSEHHIHTRGLEDLKVPFHSYVPGIDAAVGTLIKDDESIKDFEPFEVELEGEYFWELIYHIDNTGQNNPYHETRKVTKTVKTSYSDLTKYVFDASLKISQSLEAGGKFEIISATVKHSMDVELSTSYEKVVETKTESVVTEELTREFNVGANSVGSMYRLNYKGPGVSYATGTISSNDSIPLNKVIVNCRVKRQPMLQDIRVVYTSQSVDRPENVITDTFGGSPDINSKHSGDYVWLVPVWTTKADNAVTNIQVVVQNEKNENYEDLAQGAKGQYRYLKMLRNSNSHTKIKRVGLLRSTDFIYGDRQKHGWDECTQDINGDRKGDWLHLCWNTISV